MRNPFRSEADAFRFVWLTIGYFALIVIGVARSTVARRRGVRRADRGRRLVALPPAPSASRRVQQAPAPSPPDEHRILVVANETVGGPVGSVIAVWTWAMAVMMSSAMTYNWGLSGLFWFVVPNGFAVMAMIPFARILRKNMPEGYTISEFIEYRFNRSKAATAIVTRDDDLRDYSRDPHQPEGHIRRRFDRVRRSTGRSRPSSASSACLTYSYFGGLWTSVMTGTLNTLMITVPAAIVVAAVYAKIPGGTPGRVRRRRRR